MSDEVRAELAEGEDDGGEEKSEADMTEERIAEEEGGERKVLCER